MRVLALLALLGCGQHHHGQIDREKARALWDEVELATPPGVSDLTIDDRGTVWAIPERDRELDEITLPGGAVVHHPLDGVPDGLDTEALAWLGDGSFAIGTEGAHAPTASVRFAERRGDRYAITRTRELTNEELGVTLVVNKGVEAVCGRAGDLLIGIETVGKLADGTRWAPIARLTGDKLTVTHLRLTTDVGKISALYCTFEGTTAHALAIERHYSVSRVLKFDLPEGAAEVTPTVALDLEPVLHDTLNLEGITVLPDGRWVMVNDNQGATVDGPTELLVFHPR